MPLNDHTLILILSGSLVLLLGIVIYLEVRLRRLLRGKDAQTLEDTIVALSKETDSLKESRKEIESYLAIVEKRLRRAVSGISTIRFNPFKGTSGSNQSFSTAFLNEEGDGVVVSSLYSRDRVSIFAKPIKNSSSEYELTAEEKEAIAKSKV
ncbi:MAG: DUF4446 family protein [Patescibacteria group bacterium]